MRAENEGQGLVELLVSLSLVAGAFCIAASWFRVEWDRTRCAHSVFEAAHRALTETYPSVRSPIRIATDGSGISAQGQCGNLSEQVRLPYLETARW